MEQRENKYTSGDIVYAKVNPKEKLVVRRYIDKIYYCKYHDEPDRKELPLFTRELVNNEELKS